MNITILFPDNWDKEEKLSEKRKNCFIKHMLKEVLRLEPEGGTFKLMGFSANKLRYRYIAIFENTNAEGDVIVLHIDKNLGKSKKPMMFQEARSPLSAVPPLLDMLIENELEDDKYKNKIRNK